MKSEEVIEKKKLIVEGVVLLIDFSESIAVCAQIFYSIREDKRAQLRKRREYD